MNERIIQSRLHHNFTILPIYSEHIKNMMYVEHYVDCMFEFHICFSYVSNTCLNYVCENTCLTYEEHPILCSTCVAILAVYI